MTTAFAGRFFAFESFFFDRTTEKKCLSITVNEHNRWGSFFFYPLI